MKLLKILPALAIAVLALYTPLQAQSGMVKKTAATVSSGKTETFTVLGNCGMCKSTIEKAAARAGATKAVWNADTDQLSVTFDSTQTSVDAIQKAVAMSGYDNVGYKAPDDAYEKLHACCHYDRSGAPSTAKSCTEPEESQH